ncbi:uncharacterized protein LOC144440018 [Glandiceps talaboti]
MAAIPGTLRALRRMFTFIQILVYLINPSGYAEVTENVDIRNPADVIFPPIIETDDVSTPAGHLKPFGHQREPDDKVIEYDKVIHPKDFWENHVSKNIPLVFRGGAAHSSGLQKWTDEYLKERYGDLDVLIERKDEKRPQVKLRMKISYFLERYKERNWYIVSLLPNEMRHEVEAPGCLLCGNFQKNLQEMNLWMSNGGTASVIHFDADHNIHCLLEGRKDFIMIDPYYNIYLDLYKPEGAGSAFTSINVDSIDMLKFPAIDNVQWTWTTLLPGDCIYIPAEYVHQVRSYGRSISVTTLFTTHDVYNETDCRNFTLSPLSLNEVDIMWTYQKGDKTIDIGYGDLHSIREQLFMEASKDSGNVITKDDFRRMYDAFKRQHDEIVDFDEVWRILDKVDKGFITEQDIEEMDRETLKTFSHLTTSPAGPTEEYIISEKEMAIMMKFLESEEEVDERRRKEDSMDPGQHEEL